MRASISLIVLILAWFVSCDYLSLVSPNYVPRLSEVGTSFIASIDSGIFAEDICSTVRRWLFGFFLGATLGVIVGFVLGLSDALWELFEMPLEFARGIPVTAMLPLFFLLLGVGDESKIAMAALPSFLLLAVYTAGGVKRCSQQRQEMAIVFGASRAQVFYLIMVPETCPFLLLGLRLACSLSLTVTVVAEMFVGTDRGIGQRLFESYMMSSMPGLFQNILLVGFVGYCSSMLIACLEKRSLRWVGK